MATKATKEYLFKPFNADTYSATSDAWKGDIESSHGFLPEISQLMNWVSDHQVLTNNEIAFGVFESRTKIAIGICECAITRPTVRGKWVKFIRLRLRPELEERLFQNDVQATHEALNAYVCAVIGIFHVKNAHEATTIKIYGRTQEQVRFLTLLATELEKRKEITFKAVIQGRWLSLNW